MPEMKRICEIFIDGNELVIRGSDDLEFRDVLSEDSDRVDCERIWYAFFHDCII